MDSVAFQASNVLNKGGSDGKKVPNHMRAALCSVNSKSHIAYQIANANVEFSREEPLWYSAGINGCTRNVQCAHQCQANKDRPQAIPPIHKYDVRHREDSKTAKADEEYFKQRVRSIWGNGYMHEIL